MRSPLPEFAPAQLPVEVERLQDDADRVGGSHEVFDDDLLVLEDLVVLEEPPDLAQQVAGQLRVIRVVGKRRDPSR